MNFKIGNWEVGDRVAIFDKVGDVFDQVTGVSASELAKKQLENQAKAIDILGTPAQQSSPTSKMPTWGWVLIGVGSLLLIGLITYAIIQASKGK